VDYAEHPLPEALTGLVAAVWTVSLPADGPAWVEQEAVPDGCVELIRRHSGHSKWRREQPPLFATGLATGTAKLWLGGGSSFTGIKLWPWAWHALGGPACPGFADDWIEISPASPLAALTIGDPATIVARLVEAFDGIGVPPLGQALLAETTVAGIAARAGLGHRRLQRLFARDFGMPPRSYLRLLRFRDAIGAIHGTDTLADTAAAQGYADQAHMAREFRSLAGLPPSAARARAKGPFVS